MKNFFYSLFLIALTGACNQESNSNNKATEEMIIEKLPDTVSAVCIWNNISVRKAPSNEGKWLTAISLGEKLESAQIIEIDSANDNRKYVRVLLADGTKGWSLEDFIITEAEPAVFIEEAPIFERPDLLTKTEDSFSQMDIVAIKENKEGWLLVEGRRSDANWISEGWVKADKITQEKTDIAFAKYAYEAFAKDKVEEQRKALDELLNMEEFYNSIFYATLEQQYNEKYKENNEL